MINKESHCPFFHSFNRPAFCRKWRYVNPLFKSSKPTDYNLFVLSKRTQIFTKKKKNKFFFLKKKKITPPKNITTYFLLNKSSLKKTIKIFFRRCFFFSSFSL
ncbi:hypothetical protein RIR_jg14934.t1 [Rhizophagus irregularis DAOM 181602=DAOM 197198]|nr:hypothetical protein RIR_jg14934.t1 [Rhizophagus irregularis DAOM 181602=DAOM 197198]